MSSALGVVYFLHAVPYLVSPPIAGKFLEKPPTSSLCHMDNGIEQLFRLIIGYIQRDVWQEYRIPIGDSGW